MNSPFTVTEPKEIILELFKGINRVGGGDEKPVLKHTKK